MASSDIKVLLASAEVAPFSKAGGLGDVMGALPRALGEQAVDARLITPLYGDIDRTDLTLRPAGELDLFEIAMGNEHYEVRFLRTTLPNSKIVVYFVECDELFDRPGVYVDPQTGEGYGDNPLRYLLFSRAVAEFLMQGIFEPDVLHLNDNQCAPTAAMMRTMPQYADLLELPILISIHNAEYQGTCDMGYIGRAGLSYSLAYPGGPFEFYGNFNFLKAGISFANKLATVSPTYAEETMTSQNSGFGLEGLLASRRPDYTGILNGVDTTDWDPQTDPLLPQTYSAKNLDGKTVNKRELLVRCGFSEDDIDKPLLGVISRLVYQKGIDLLIDAMGEYLTPDTRMVVLGTGDPHYHYQLSQAQQRWPDRLAVFLAFDNGLAHLIEAGADMFLMPSRFEPCGLNQLYSLKYGTIPVVRRTGGLADTVQDYEADEDKGWGFVFGGFNPFDLSHAIRRAKEVYYDRQQWVRLQQRAMMLDFSWERSAKQYKQLYEDMLHD